MPHIGGLEIFLIVSVAILVVGPEDFPIMLKKIGSWIGSIKKYFSTLQEEISDYETFEVDESKNNKNKKNKDEK